MGHLSAVSHSEAQRISPAHPCPSAGSQTITINANALDKHLLNHVKAEGFVGDDHVGACADPTTEPTAEPTPPD